MTTSQDGATLASSLPYEVGASTSGYGHWLPSKRPEKSSEHDDMSNTKDGKGPAEEENQEEDRLMSGGDRAETSPPGEAHTTPTPPATSASADSQAKATESNDSPPPLPPRPTIHQRLETQLHSPTGSLRLSKSSNRPHLQSKATTALSVAQLYKDLPAESGSNSEGLQVPGLRPARSITNLRQYGERRASDMADTASIRSARSARSIMSGYSRPTDVESLLEDMLEQGYDEGLGGGGIFESHQHEDAQFELIFKYEFDELEELEQDGSNEEVLTIRWRSKLKHFMILSSAGKPIWSRHGDSQLISNSVGVIQTIISFYQGDDDTLRGFTAGDTRFAVLSKGHLHLVAISRIEENDSQLRTQLEALYMQILSTLTLPSMQKMFINRPSTDLRRPLEGTTTLLSALADTFTRGSPSTLLSALECLRLRKAHRESISRALAQSRTPSLLYGLIVADGRLVSVLRPKKHSLHPGDLQLIFNMLFSADGIRAGGGENWIPLCLPGFNNTGYIYMYVSFVPSETSSATEVSDTTETKKKDEIAIILISANKEAFFELRGMRDTLLKNLTSANPNLLSTIRTSMQAGRPSITDIAPGTPIRHFLYKSRANVQFTMPSSDTEIGSPIAWRRLMTTYANLHGAVHGRGGAGGAVGGAGVKVFSCVSRQYVALVWVRPGFELYVVAGAGANRNALAIGAGRVVQWVRREEERVFILGGAVF